jgi:hypothetical protein
VNLLVDSIDTIKNRETVADASRKVDLEANSEKAKYMLLSCHQNAEQNHDQKRANRSFENTAQLKHLGTMVKMKF